MLDRTEKESFFVPRLHPTRLQELFFRAALPNIRFGGLVSDVQSRRVRRRRRGRRYGARGVDVVGRDVTVVTTDSGRVEISALNSTPARFQRSLLASGRLIKPTISS